MRYTESSLNPNLGGKQMVRVHGISVHGCSVDAETRCAHYHSVLDIIAIKFFCCQMYYPCHLCHEAVADHPAQTWPADHFHEKAILCGACGSELTIEEYLACASRCPYCRTRFNPGCARHAPLYFDTPVIR